MLKQEEKLGSAHLLWDIVEKSKRELHSSGQEAKDKHGSTWGIDVAPQMYEVSLILL